MAARLNPLHDQRTREKIKTSQLLNRLQAHAFGKVEMTPTQVRAAEILLKKVLPDTSAHTVQGHIAHDHTVKSEPLSETDRWIREIIDGGAEGKVPKPLLN